MEQSVFNISSAVLSAFLEAVEGNYRNSIYVTCSCDHVIERGCRDFLIAMGQDCKPVVVPVSVAEAFLGIAIDKRECIARMSSSTFVCLYHKWVLSISKTDEMCPMLLASCQSK